ncbi:hypothetical protein [Alteromonas lipolytica]|uniref:Solute-binding protein family 3/N-terminal domain-containing protein n=1 Tax=Alteromonas lipolytica TaxID=1856405 RepID=A0A1E8FFX5_9ALTE|nr:hypothetical protein [Alteromonas lipolytica]OFI34830.1 hypothetical protein BFC17_14745 [Alteromonas lipolytica]GGF54343.1 hypothetical protein GCM10011338_03160 [Alteromonas lipolytica]
MPQFYLFIAALLALPISPVAAETEPKPKRVIVGAQLSGLFHIPGEHEGPGVYNEILQHALDESGLADEVEIIVMPMSRAKRGFVDKLYACYAPGIATFDLNDDTKDLQDVLISIPLNQAMVRIIVRDEQQIVHQLSDIPDHAVISIVRGTPMSEEMQALADRVMQTFYVSSETENVQMLVAGKVDYLLSFYPDVLFAYKELGMKPLPYSKDFSPLSIDDTMICHKGYEHIFTVINNQLKTFAKNGMFRQMLGEFYTGPEPEALQTPH